MTQCKAALHYEKYDNRNGSCRCGSCFTIYHGPYGILISAPIGIDDLCKLMKAFADLYDYDICDSLIAGATQSALCITTREKSELWRKHLRLTPLI